MHTAAYLGHRYCIANFHFHMICTKLVSLRVDADVLAWFKKQANGRFYTALMNKALRMYALGHEK